MPDVWGDLGLHFSFHQDGHTHLKTTKAPFIHEDFNINALRPEKFLQPVDEPPAENEPAKIYLFNPNHFLRQFRTPVDNRGNISSHMGFSD